MNEDIANTVKIVLPTVATSRYIDFCVLNSGHIDIVRGSKYSRAHTQQCDNAILCAELYATRIKSEITYLRH